MALNPRSPSTHNEMMMRFIKHPKSTNSDGDKERPAKRQKLDASPSKKRPAAAKYANREIPDSDAEEDYENIERGVGEGPEIHKTDLESALPPVKADAEAIEEYEEFKASQTESKEETETRLKDRKWIRGKTSIYVDAFNLALDTVLDEESHLFDEAEREVFRIWKDMSYEAQYL
jgi:Fanconi-associated nuclease 1